MKKVGSQQSVVSSLRNVVAVSRQIGTSFAPTLPDLPVKLKTKNVVRLVNRYVLLFLSLVSLVSMAIAQPDSTVASSPVQMATGLRSNGKIYVVVAVLVIILTGLFFYLIRLDRKITRLEKGENS